VLELKFPEPLSHELILEPKQTKKGSATPSFKSKITLGEPLTQAIRKDAAESDPDLQQFLQQQSKQWNFFAVQLACTFTANSGEQFEQAFIKVALSATGAASAAPPIAWSMRPFKLTQKIDSPGKVELGAELKFGPVVSVEPIVKVPVPAKVTVYLQAYNELQADPYWRFKATSGQVIEGGQRLHMVVRVPKNVEAKGAVSVEADIKKSKFGLFSLNGRVPNAAQSSFLMKG
jgi:hypothetical protein